MVGRTRLHQAPRSPLISGRTLLARPLWRDALAGLGVAFAIVVATDLVPAVSGAPPPLGVLSWASGRLWPALISIVAASVGALVGARLARAWGAVRCWMLATAAALASGWGAAMVAWFTSSR